MRILLIEDDRKAGRLLARGLQEEGFVVDVAASAEDGDERIYATEYDLLILDWLLPGKDGIALCRELRQRNKQIPIFMLTARDGLADRVAGLNTGADDYLTKPFAFDELLARIRALLRRSDLARPLILTVGELALDPQKQTAARGAATLKLTRKEFAILELLMRKAGEVVSRARLAERVWEIDAIGSDNLIDVHISNLRRKIDTPGAPSIIQTVRGRGFLVEEERKTNA
jgi:DNA-binding response OmpR family regulator